MSAQHPKTPKNPTPEKTLKTQQLPQKTPPSQQPALPRWLKITYTLMVAVILPVYWRDHGPVNFLWFSDIALILLVPALWLENALLFSMMAVGVLPMETVWLIDFLSGGNLTGVAGYMFDDADMPLYLRALSGFHFVLPSVMVYGVYRLGYDRRAFLAQVCLAALVLPLTYFAGNPAADNINWVYGPGFVQSLLPPLVYLAVYFLVLTGAVYTPVHIILKKISRAA